MTEAREISCRPLRTRALWFFCGLGAAGAILSAVRAVYAGPDVGLGAGLLFAALGIASLRAATVRLGADAHGLNSRMLLRCLSVPWSEVADLHVRLKYANESRVPDSRRVRVVLRDGRKRLLPLPQSRSGDDPDFDAKLDALRALHRRYGTPESSHVPVVSYRTAGHRRAGSLGACVLLLAGAGVAGWFVPSVAAGEQEWKSARPCTVRAPDTESKGECLATRSAVIARTEANRPKQDSYLYFSGGRPLARAVVSSEAAHGFRQGDRVEVTFWRGEVREIAGERHVWREHVPAAGEAAVIAAALALGAGYPGARVGLRLRGRRLADDEVLPSALPFVGALFGTALWLLPLCYLHPMTLFSSPVAIMWAAAGSAVTLGLFVWAWRASRVRTPGEAREEGEAGGAGATGGPAGEEAFLAARFLEHTDYNPHGFGTHIVLGGGPPAVTPTAGPGRFAARRIPVERLTVKQVRRARGDDGEIFPRSWHIAELDDAGRPVRLAAAPADLTRIVRELGAGPAPAHPATTARSKPVNPVKRAP